MEGRRGFLKRIGVLILGAAASAGAVGTTIAYRNGYRSGYRNALGDVKNVIKTPESVPVEFIEGKVISESPMHLDFTEPVNGRLWGINGNIYSIEGAFSTKTLWGQPDLNIPAGYETTFYYRPLRMTPERLREIYNLVPDKNLEFSGNRPAVQDGLDRVEGIINSFVPS